MSESRYYRSSFGTVRLWIKDLKTDKSRDKVVHSPATGDKHTVQDRGQVNCNTSASLLFDYMRGDTLTPVDRLNEFKALVQQGTSQVLTHPVEGSFMASVGRFIYGLDEHGQLSAECEFLADDAVSDAIPAGAASIPASGEGLVDAAADAYTAEYKELGLDDGGLGATTKASADAWVSATTVNTRQVLVETGQYSSQLSSKSELLTDDMEQWQAFKNTLMLAESVRVAAESATSDTASSFVVRIATNTPLRTLLASEYGADEVDFRYRQAIDLNDIATPGLLEVGQELQLPSRTPRARNG